MRLLPACMYVYHVHAWCPWKQDEGVKMYVVVSLYVGAWNQITVFFARAASALFL